MADRTHIEWTDATWNVITGCSVVSAGCKHCYAMKLAGTRLAQHPSREGLTIDTAAGPVWNGQVRFNGPWLTQPLAWSRPRRIFVCAHGDLFHEAVPGEWIDQVFAVMALAPQHTFQVLTKRASRMQQYLSDENVLPRIEVAARRIWRELYGQQIAGKVLIGPLPNVWLGVSVEDQAAADARIPELLMTPAAVRWISAEPLLGPVDLAARDYLREHRDHDGQIPHGLGRLDWVIVGGESGRNARPMSPDWVRSLRDQCAAAGVPFLFKQWGEWAPADRDTCATPACGFIHPTLPEIPRPPEPRTLGVGYGPNELAEMGCAFVAKVGKKRAGRLLDGVEHNAFPEVAHA